MEIRDARPDEAESLEGLQRAASAVWDAHREQLAEHPDAIERIGDAEFLAGRVRVAVEEGRVLGFSAVLAQDADGVELDGLFVEPGAMGRGVGRALVEDALARAAPAPVTVIAGPEAEGFYARCGFVRVADASTRFGPAARWRMTPPGYSGRGPADAAASTASSSHQDQ